MGGALGRGNSGVLSEFNIEVDPEAARIVFESGIPLVMAPLEVGKKALIYPDESEAIQKMNKTGDMLYHLFKKYRGGSFETGLTMYDSFAIAYLLKPEMFEMKQTFVGIELTGEYTSGATIVDLDNLLGKEENCEVCIDVDEAIFKQWFKDGLKQCK